MKTFLKFTAILALLVVRPGVTTRSVRAAITQDSRPFSPPRAINPYFEFNHPMEEPPVPAGQPSTPDPYEKYLETAKAQKADLLDRVRWDGMMEGAQALAVFAYNTAQTQDLIPPKPLKKDEQKDEEK
jgi:hypothetical protein